MKKDNKDKQIEYLQQMMNQRLQNNYITKDQKHQTKPVKDELDKTDYIKEMLKHLDFLFEDVDSDVFIEIRNISNKVDNDRSDYERNTAVNREKLARKYALRKNICVGVNGRIVEAGTDDAVIEARVLFVDFDRIDKSIPLNVPYIEIVNALKKLNLNPAFGIFSGNGYHFYFKLSETITAHEFTKFQKAIAHYINNHTSFENLFVDDKISNPSRVMRLAGTLNVKENENEAKVTRIIYEDQTAVLDVNEIRKLLLSEMEQQTVNTYQNGCDLDSVSKDELNTLIEKVKEVFIEGQRQYLTMGLAGILAKMNISEDEALRIYHIHFASIDDTKDLRMREACIKRTYKLYKNNQNIAGASLLKELKVQLPPLKKNSEPKTTNTDILRSKLKIFTAEQLNQIQFEHREHIIENMLTEGLNLLAGKSKLGKSWFALYLALHVASHTPLFNLFTVKNSDKYVTYFVLEDFEERIKSRQDKLLTNLKLNDSDFSKRLRYITNTVQYRFVLDEEGFHLLDYFSKDSSLIIIDTYARAKQYKNNKNEYDYETQILSRIQTIAFENHTSILLIHHTRKAHSEDVFDTVLGSTAIMGVADTILIFERMRKQELIKLHITGRDVEEQSIAIKFDKEKACFTFEGNAEMLELSELQREVLEMLKKEALSFSEIKKRTNKGDGTVYKILQKLIEENLITEIKQSNRTIFIAK